MIDILGFRYAMGRTLECAVQGPTNAAKAHGCAPAAREAQDARERPQPNLHETRPRNIVAAFILCRLG